MKYKWDSLCFDQHALYHCKYILYVESDTFPGECLVWAKDSDNAKHMISKHIPGAVCFYARLKRVLLKETFYDDMFEENEGTKYGNKNNS